MGEGHENLKCQGTSYDGNIFKNPVSSLYTQKQLETGTTCRLKREGVVNQKK